MFIAKKKAQQLNSNNNEDKLETPVGAEHSSAIEWQRVNQSCHHHAQTVPVAVFTTVTLLPDPSPDPFPRLLRSLRGGQKIDF